MVKLGNGEHTYEVSGDNWGDLPEGWVYKEATAVAVDSKDNVYVFNRGGHPVIVFDSSGRFINSWGEDVFEVPHGIEIGPDDSVYCADVSTNTITKLTPDGEVIFTLGDPDNVPPAMSGDPFNRPTHIAVDPKSNDFYVSDGYGNARVHKYDSDGKHILSWGESGTCLLYTSPSPRD